MVIPHAGGHIGVQRRQISPGEIAAVAADDLVQRVADRQAGQEIRLLVQDLGGDGLADADHILPPQHLCDVRRVDLGGSGLQLRVHGAVRRGGEVGPQGQSLKCLHQLPHRLGAAVVSDVDHVHEYRGGAPGHQDPGQSIGPQHGGVHVHMGIDHAGHGVIVRAVDDLPGFRHGAGGDGDDPVPTHGDVRAVDLLGIDVDQAAVFQQQRGLFPAQRHLDPVPQDLDLRLSRHVCQGDRL